VRARAEPEHLEVRHADHHPRDRREFADLLRQVLRQAHGILRNVDVEAAQADVVRAVQKAAQRIAAVAGQHSLVLLGGGAGHDRSGELLKKERRRSFGAEVAQIRHRRVAPLVEEVVARREGLLLVFDDHRARHGVHLLLLEFGHQCGQTLLCQTRGKTVPRDADNPDLDLWHVCEFHGAPC
jgi:hypothetical protein